MKKNILITGKPGTGKTTIIKKLVPYLTNCAGFLTEEIRKNGERKGFKIITLDNKSAILASVENLSDYRVGKYYVNLTEFEKIAIPCIEDAIINDKIKIIVIDEIGKMELLSERFKKTLLNAFESPKRIIATIKESFDAFTHNLKRRDDVEIFLITIENREEIFFEILKHLKD